MHTFFPVIQSIFDDILEDPPETLFISHKIHPFIADVDLWDDPVFLPFIIIGKNGVFYEPVGAALRERHLISVIFQLGKQEHLLQHLFQAFDPFLYDTDIIRLLFFTSPFFQKLKIPVKRGQRRADIVGKAGVDLRDHPLLLLMRAPFRTAHVQKLIERICKLL